MGGHQDPISLKGKTSKSPFLKGDEGGFFRLVIIREQETLTVPPFGSLKK
jgi:hypothetical protein